MGQFTFVSVIALFCYFFLFMTLMASQKNRIIKSFLLVLGAMILWTGGSLLMRLQLWPSIKFWFDVSIFGLLLLGYALYNFAFAFIGCKNRLANAAWLVVTIAMNVINIATGVFLAAPELKEQNGSLEFIYTLHWPVVFLFIFCTAIIAHMFKLLFGKKKTRKSHVSSSGPSSSVFSSCLRGILPSSFLSSKEFLLISSPGCSTPPACFMHSIAADCSV